MKALTQKRSLNWGGEGKVLLRCGGVTEEGADTLGTGPGGDRVACWTRTSWSWQHGPHPRRPPWTGEHSSYPVPYRCRCSDPRVHAGDMDSLAILSNYLPSHRCSGFPSLPGQEVTAIVLNFNWTQKEARHETGGWPSVQASLHCSGALTQNNLSFTLI